MSDPSIFNDVLGPVMRGPSSSHSAGALRIGRLALNLMNGNLKSALVEYDPNGSLVTTHKSQGSDMGLFGGFLGWEADDERLMQYETHLHAAGIKVDISYVRYGATHPNTYKLTLKNGEFSHQMIALSTGGGMIEVISIDETPVSMNGGSYELILYSNTSESLSTWLKQTFDFDLIIVCPGKNPFVEVKSSKPFDAAQLTSITQHKQVSQHRLLFPVLPILDRPNMRLPFSNSREMQSYTESAKTDSQLWELAIQYEQARSGLDQKQLMGKMKTIYQLMFKAAETGLAGTDYKDRILQSQSPTFKQKKDKNELLQTGILNEIIMRVTAIMEAKSSMNTIVAAPTAGSCGAMPGAVLGAAAYLNADEEEICKALFAAGLIGVFIAKDATFAAEEAGCMAECGAGSAMAAAALVTLQNGSREQSLAAASMALQNSFGMICDPIANRVEAPCLGKNVMAASNALSCANMALANYQHLIPLHEVIEAMAKVGKVIPHELRCTALGGLSITPTAKKIEIQLGDAKPDHNIIRFKSC